MFIFVYYFMLKYFYPTVMCRDIFRSCVLWSVVNLGQDYLFAEQWQLGHVWEVCFEVCVVAEQNDMLQL